MTEHVERKAGVDAIDRRWVRRLRYAFQWALFLIVVLGGVRLYLFERHFLLGSVYVERPSLVDGFLPIGSLMALKRWASTGVFDRVHPAGIVIFGAALLMALLLRKGFCGWVCPVGTFSEQLFRLWGGIFRRNLTLPKALDYPLRSLKYVLMAFFLWIVIVKMDARAIGEFLSTPYWTVADIKMLHFFTGMSGTTMLVLGVLVLLSLPIRNFWCRYLCPYGALLGLLALASPAAIRRSEDACIHCGRCTRNCPASIDVEGKAVVRSPECTGCLTCVSGCPARGALDMSLGGRIVKPLVFAFLIATLFLGVIGVAMVSGRWKSAVTYEEYKANIPLVSKMEHP